MFWIAKSIKIESWQVVFLQSWVTRARHSGFFIEYAILIVETKTKNHETSNSKTNKEANLTDSQRG